MLPPSLVTLGTGGSEVAEAEAAARKDRLDAVEGAGEGIRAVGSSEILLEPLRALLYSVGA